MATYRLGGMNCGNCVQKIQNALLGISSAVVTLSPPRLVIDGAQDPGIEVLRQKISAAGNYTIALPARADAIKAWATTYYPLLLIVAFIFVCSFAGGGGLHGWMTNFMAGFFLVFSFFKLLNLKGFAEAFAGYDLLAARSRVYALAYPFIELALGLMFLFRIAETFAVLVAFAIMSFGAVGVIRAVRDNKKIRCACLGTVLNLPMSTLTIVENTGMAAMSLAMLAY